MLQKICFLLFSLLAITVNQIHAQSDTWTVSGVIKSDTTQEPISGASIFISNSTKATVSDEKGKFEFAGLANGNYNLVVSSIGYETQIYPVAINNKNENILLTLKPAPKELEGVVINLKNGDRDEQLKVFRQGFLGTDKNAKQTSIDNEDVLKMHTEESGKVFHAHTTQLLSLTNKALGYHLRYLLKDFYYNKKTGDLRYVGFPLFEEMKPSSNSERKKWLENRKNVYEFSLLRFYRTMAKRNLIAEGYMVGRLTPAPSGNKLSGVSPAERKVDPDNTFTLTLMNQQYFDSLYWPEIPYYKIMKALPGHKFELDFQDMLSVDATSYNGDSKAADYYKPGNRTSIITLNDPVIINEYGIPDDPSKIVYYGFWMQQRIANLLPFDYHPENK